MPRPAKWNSPTESVRLPAHAIVQCLKLAQLLDRQQQTDFVQNLNPLLVTIGKGAEEEQYLVQPEPLTREQAEECDRLADQFIAELKAAGVRKGAEVLAIAELAKRCGRKMRGGCDNFL